MTQKLTPYFTVTNADEFISFVINVFNAELFKENRYSDGSLQHGRLLVEDSVIMLNQATDDYKPNQSQMHLHVDSIEETYRRALEHGGASLMEPMLRPHGERMAGFTDPCGNIWWVAEKADQKP